MATAFRKLSRATIVPHFLLRRTVFTATKATRYTAYIRAACGCFAGTAIACYVVKCNFGSRFDTTVSASKGDDQRSSEKRAVLQTQRELRFLSFASVEHDGNVYMTPEDFLESVTEEAPRPRSGRRHISLAEVERCFRTTPGKKYGSTLLFRNLHDKGLISYTEYLFLLCVLTKPKSGFKIAFNMFDTDGNQRVDKNEFLVLLDVYENRFGYSTIRQTERVHHHVSSSSSMANIWSKVQHIVSSEGDGSAPIADTTLTVHFFGRKGNDTLRYEDFHRFMDNLQTEVLELEFGEFSKGMRTITELEFAKILLRYTILTADDHDEYLDRLRKKVHTSKGITFKEFKDFCQFLNNLDDFALAMRMYTYANHPISQNEFKRAVMACTGQVLSDHVVDVVYKLFDKDDDNHLSHKEFISVMKDRLHRGFRNYPLYQNNWETFKSCVKNQMRAS